MYHCETLESHHKDLVHDVSFNWYGNRLATCSSDQSVKIWEWNTDQQSWDCSASWKAHSGSVWKVNWAHPEFGNVRRPRDTDLIENPSRDRQASL